MATAFTARSPLSSVTTTRVFRSTTSAIRKYKRAPNRDVRPGFLPNLSNLDARALLLFIPFRRLKLHYVRRSVLVLQPLKSRSFRVSSSHYAGGLRIQNRRRGSTSPEIRPSETKRALSTRLLVPEHRSPIWRPREEGARDEAPSRTISYAYA